MLMGSSAMPSSSVAALLPFFFLLYHMNMQNEKKFVADAKQPKKKA